MRGLSAANFKKLVYLKKRTGLTDNNLIGLLLNIGDWIVEERFALSDPSFVAISAERREYMPDFPFLDKLKLN